MKLNKITLQHNKIALNDIVFLIHNCELFLKQNYFNVAFYYHHSTHRTSIFLLILYFLPGPTATIVMK